MEELQKNHINQNLSALVDVTKYNTACTTVLVENAIFGDDDVEFLESIPNERKKVLEFNRLIMTKADSYGHLITAMEKGKQSGALTILNSLNVKSHFSGADGQAFELLPAIPNSQVHKLVPRNLGEQTFKPIRFDVLDPVRLFTGRIEELKKLHKNLQQSNTQMAVISQMASDVGLGGIGKTELARCYIQNYSEAYENNVIWINAETEETLTGGFRRLATDYLKLSTLNADGNEKQITSIIDEVYNFFNERRSLFVFDNAESNEYMQQFMPLRVSNKPYLLITSRDKEWSFSVKALELHEMEKQEAIEFVKKGLQIQDDSQDHTIIQLVDRLQSFPLALSQAVSYVKQKQFLNTFSIDDYLKLFESASEKLLNSNQPSAELNSYTKTTLTTWKVTTNLISNIQDAGKQATLMLNMISYYLPDKIPIRLLTSDNTQIKKTSVNEKALRLLVKYSMVNIQRLEKTVSIHRLVQEVNRTELKRTKKDKATLKKALEWFPENTDIEYISHACSVFKYCGAHKTLVVEFKPITWILLDRFSPRKHVNPDDVDFIKLERRIADLEFDLGNFESSQNTLERIFPLFLENKGGLLSQDEIIWAQQQLAGTLKALGRRTECLEFLFKSYQKLKALKGINYWQTIETLVAIADCLRDLGHFHENLQANAEYIKLLTGDFCAPDEQLFVSNFQRAFETKKKLIGSSYSYNNTFYKVAVCLRSLGEKEMASLIASYSYEVGKNSEDSNIQHPAINCLNILAVLKSDEGKHKEAFAMYQEVHTFCSSKLGDKHLRTLLIRRNMFVEQRNLGQIEIALEGNQGILKTMLTYYPDVPEVPELETWIAVTLGKMKRYNESLALLCVLKAKIQEKFPQLESLLFSVNCLIEEVQNYVD